MSSDAAPLLHFHSLMTTPADSAIRRRLFRDSTTQALLRASEVDLNDRRSRFVPRKSLKRVLSLDCVLRLLETLSEHGIAETVGLEELARRISPDPAQCSCHDKTCTGGRMILATLLLIGKDDLIPSLFSCKTPWVCDRSLPVSLVGPSKDAADHSMAGEAQLATLLPSLLSAKETELFACSQWQVCTPFLTEFNSDDNIKTFPSQMTLPWVEIERMGHSVQGDSYYVERIRIHPDNHALVSCTDQVCIKLG